MFNPNETLQNILNFISSTEASRKISEIPSTFWENATNNQKKHLPVDLSAEMQKRLENKKLFLINVIKNKECLEMAINDPKTSDEQKRHLVHQSIKFLVLTEYFTTEEIMGMTDKEVTQITDPNIFNFIIADILLPLHARQMTNEKYNNLSDSNLYPLIMGHYLLPQTAGDLDFLPKAHLSDKRFHSFIFDGFPIEILLNLKTHEERHALYETLTKNSGIQEQQDCSPPQSSQSF